MGWMETIKTVLTMLADVNYIFEYDAEIRELTFMEDNLKKEKIKAMTTVEYYPVFRTKNPIQMAIYSFLLKIGCTGR